MLKYQYGTYRYKWPKKTILLCQCSVETTSGEKYAVTPLIRFNNIFKGNHAEEEMINYLENHTQSLLKLPGICNAKLSMILSYSPCNICSEAILEFKSNFKKFTQCSLEIEIKFSNIYNCYESQNSHVKGLHELISGGVRLSVFCGKNDWKWFTNEKICLDSDFVYNKEREDRELVDLCILQCIKNAKKEDVKSGDLCLLIQRMSVNGVMSFFKL
jgi:cytidine deaminase